MGFFIIHPVKVCHTNVAIPKNRPTGLGSYEIKVRKKCLNKMNGYNWKYLIFFKQLKLDSIIL